ncbi:hypothetical protein GQ42DRAFT_152166 [Ramicandelaber brevisporus]|nr:hypothetical protein GQ42DRAFT_152166 [Ramicandelaber brevisporus]
MHEQLAVHLTTLAISSSDTDSTAATELTVRFHCESKSEFDHLQVACSLQQSAGVLTVGPTDTVRDICDKLLDDCLPLKSLLVVRAAWYDRLHLAIAGEPLDDTETAQALVTKCSGKELQAWMSPPGGSPPQSTLPGSSAAATTTTTAANTATEAVAEKEAEPQQPASTTAQQMPSNPKTIIPIGPAFQYVLADGVPCIMPLPYTASPFHCNSCSSKINATGIEVPQHTDGFVYEQTTADGRPVCQHCLQQSNLFSGLVAAIERPQRLGAL